MPNPMTASDLWDRFAPEADPVKMAQMNIYAIAVQVHDLRVNEPDNIDMTDRHIAWELWGFAAGLPDA